MRLIPSAALLSAFTLVAGLANAETTLSFLVDNGAASVASAEANYRETYGARSKAEFISKPGDCLRELEKPACWLELRVESGCVVANRLSTLREETDGLIAIFPRMVKRSPLSN